MKTLTGSHAATSRCMVGCNNARSCSFRPHAVDFCACAIHAFLPEQRFVSVRGHLSSHSRPARFASYQSALSIDSCNPRCQRLSACELCATKIVGSRAVPQRRVLPVAFGLLRSDRVPSGIQPCMLQGDAFPSAGMQACMLHSDVFSLCPACRMWRLAVATFRRQHRARP